MNKIMLCIIWLNIFCFNLYGYPWPVKDFNTQHQISGTVGEYRTEPSLHFHAGVDIPWNQGDSVFAVDSGIVDSVIKWVGRFRYVHIDFKINNNDTLGPGNFIGLVNYPDAPHVHFREAPDSSNRTPVVNNLFSGTLTPYVDSTNPYIDSIKFYRQGPGDTLLYKDTLDRKVDVLAIARDTRTDSTGHVPAVPGTTSVYRIGYVVKDTSGNVKKTYWEKIKFDTIPNPSSSSQLNLTYGSGSSSSHFRYWVSNDPFNSNSDLRNWYWNTKQQAGQPDSVDADSIDVAKFKDGYYWVIVKAYDIKNNADSESVYVHVDNFNPRIKETRFAAIKRSTVIKRFAVIKRSTVIKRFAVIKHFIVIEHLRLETCFAEGNFLNSRILNISTNFLNCDIKYSLDRVYDICTIKQRKGRYEGLAGVCTSGGLDTFYYFFA